LQGEDKMNVKNLCEELKKYSDVMDLNAPLDQEELLAFQKENSIKLPDSLAELLLSFNGGEIFIPGTVIYGLSKYKKIETIKYVNRREFRKQFSIPNTYLIFAKLNYGDLICINLNYPYDIIQWDHEADEQFCTWDSLEEWLDETIKSYIDFKGGNA